MSSSPEQPQIHLNTHPNSSTENTLVALYITAQINDKLAPSNFPYWCAQFEALLIGYDLLDYVTGISKCPSPSDPSISALHKTHWIRQDKLILSVILASTSPTITPRITTAKTFYEAWKKLNTLYASKLRTRAMQLKKELTLIQYGNRFISNYLHTLKALVDEIAIIDHPISDDDLTVYVLNAYKTRDTAISDVGGFENLELSLLLFNDEFIRELNKEWRDEDHPTDVLSMSQHAPELKLPVVRLYL
ncbi:uncharacterized protein LOC122274594 [Carya illinoinensis]|uniref:uncharacterized protein LOC122274594 n=1 Tax=Carya illinoinensis TaxID=32201 RepID=UPI001C7286D8|nr:uncharacterized protein LOC122274594 [Carya illinoinensis]